MSRPHSLSRASSLIRHKDRTAKTILCVGMICEGRDHFFERVPAFPPVYRIGPRFVFPLVPLVDAFFFVLVYPSLPFPFRIDSSRQTPSSGCLPPSRIGPVRNTSSCIVPAYFPPPDKPPPLVLIRWEDYSSWTVEKASPPGVPRFFVFFLIQGVPKAGSLGGSGFPNLELLILAVREGSETYSWCLRLFFRPLFSTARTWAHR